MTMTEMSTTVLLDDPLAAFWASAISALVAAFIGMVAAVLGGTKPAGAGALIRVCASRGGIADDELPAAFPPEVEDGVALGGFD